MNYKKQVEDFKRKFGIKQINDTNLRSILNKQGYTVIDFNGIDDDEDVTILSEALGIGKYMRQYRCFTYRNDKYRLVFVHENLNEEERLVAFAHEEGHIWNDHLSKDSVLGNDIIQEYEANEFAHYLLKKKNEKKGNKYFIILTCLIIITFGLGFGLLFKHERDKSIYADELYRTKTGAKYHNKDCMYIRGKKNVYKLTQEEFDSGEYEPCSVCMPDRK